MTNVRKTIVIDPALWEQFKSTMKRHGVTLDAAIDSAIRQEIDRRNAAQLPRSRRSA